MRNKREISFYEIVTETENFLQLQASKQIWAEMTVSVTATLSDIFEKEEDLLLFFNIKQKDKRTIEALSILHWYLPDEIRVFLNIELQKVARHHQYARSVLILESKSYALMTVIQIYLEKGPRFLFGRFLEKNLYDNLFLAFEIKVKKEKHPTLPEIRRIGVGYKDKGHLPDLARGGALSKVFNKPLQIKIDENRKIFQDTVSILEGFYN